ncbi:MAG: porin [Gemmatimonadetes bacterium]|nr:porin [Gemmatimonadota bacterium]
MTKQRILRLGALVAGLVAGGPWPAPAQQRAAPPVDPLRVEATSLDSMAAALAQLDQRIRVLERRLELEREAADAARRAAATVAVGADGAAFRSGDGVFTLRVRGYIQEDGRFFLGADRIGASTFVLRRVRPILEGTVFGRYDYRLMADFGGGTASIQEAYIDARYRPALGLRFGKFKPPVGLERLRSATAITFAERALPTDLVPNRDIGVQLWGDVWRGAFSYAVGAFNGVPDGGSADADSDDGKDVAARIFAHPFRAAGPPVLRGLGLGVAATTGAQTGTPAAPALAVYRTPLQQGFFAYRADGQAAGTVVADGTRTRLSPQGYLYAGPLGLLGEYVVVAQHVRRDSTAATLRSRGWQVAASWVVTGEAAGFGGVRPRASFDPTAHGWGALELTARLHGIDVDAAAVPTFADPVRAATAARAWSLGANWYVNRNVRLVLDYEHTTFTGGRAAGDRPAERGIVGRAQLAF